MNKKLLGSNLILIFSVFIIQSCGLLGGGKDGYVRETPVSNYQADKSNPLGMVFVRDGSFTFGGNDENADFNFVNKKKDKTILGFWLDQTEITNDKYRTFVFWV